MPSLMVRTVMFVSSYSPLLAIFGLLGTFGPGWPSVACLVVAAISVVGLTVFWSIARNQPTREIRIIKSRPRSSESTAFFATYVIPFAAAQTPDLGTRLALVVFLITIAGIYLRNDLFYVNPLLGLAGVRAYDVETDAGIPAIVLTTRKFMKQRMTLDVSDLSEYVLLGTRK